MPHFKGPQSCSLCLHLQCQMALNSTDTHKEAPLKSVRRCKIRPPIKSFKLHLKEIATVKCFHEQFPHRYNYYPWEERNTYNSRAAYVFLDHSWLYTLHVWRTKFQFIQPRFGIEAPSVGYRLNQCIASEFAFFFALQNLHFSVHFSTAKNNTYTIYIFRLRYTIKSTLEMDYVQKNASHTNEFSHLFSPS